MLATALALSCAIWTEDTDFFGTGIAVWTSDRIEIFLKEQLKSGTSRLSLFLKGTAFRPSIK